MQSRAPPRLSSAGRPPLVLTPSELMPPPFHPRESTTDERDELVVAAKGLFLSSYRTARNAAALRACGITHILSVGSEFADDRKTGRGEFEQLVKDIDDDADDETSAVLVRSLHEMCAFIDRAIGAGGAVLVHCAAGASRSPTVVLAYMITRAVHPTLLAAFDHLYRVRPCMWPNEGFMRSLISLEVGLTGVASIDLDDYCAWSEYDAPADGVDRSASAIRLAGLDTAKFAGGDRAEAAAMKASRWGLHAYACSEGAGAREGREALRMSKRNGIDDVSLSGSESPDVHAAASSTTLHSARIGDAHDGGGSACRAARPGGWAPSAPYPVAQDSPVP